MKKTMKRNIEVLINETAIVGENDNIDNDSYEQDFCINTVTEYLRTIGKYDVLTPDEEKELAYKIKSGDMQARQKFIEHNAKLVFFAARKRASRSPLKLEDLISAGNIGLIEAVDKFDPEKNTKFSTYAMFMINAAMIREEENFARPIRLPVYLVQAKNRINKAKNKLKAISTEPTVDDLVQITGCNEKQVKRVLSIDQRFYSLNNEFGNDKESEGLDFFTSSENVEEEVVNKIALEEIREEILRVFYNKLTANQQKVFKMKYIDGLNHGEIAKRIGISREGVRQLEIKLLEKFRLHLAINN